ncbi:hypothetical protein BDA96_05G223300 [Sorghum bicolor]|uniref:F-box domain-containing protein n=1 Tax=Sorghum bicolor TaxID=4558 RepID=A0A921R1C9_SORBI|nr:hypothetical protein BDA96_05G223300 [Sorghum bicolor]
METAAAAALPDDLLAGVLGRLPARSLAASRGTCKAWRDLIDERQLLVRFRRLLPHSVRGLFINYQDYRRPHFLSRPTPTSSPEAAADGGHRQIDARGPLQLSWYEVADHCNGLVLFTEGHGEVLHVCNPITRWSARPPPCPAGTYDLYYSAGNYGRRTFLVFDPLVSPEYYKVVLTPAEPGREQMEKDGACRRTEWPPSAWASWHEFSSATGRWEEKVLLREGEAAAGTAGDLLLYKHRWGFHVDPPCRYAAYWKGALYVHWHGRSEKGVYMAAITQECLPILRVWTLSESSGGHMEWVPKHQSNLKINAHFWCVENNNFDELKYWNLDLDPEYSMFGLDNGRKNQDVSLEQNVSWNSDDDNIVDISDDKHEIHPYVNFLGFHPYKEVIFLSRDSYAAVAFHLNSPKIQYLGTVHLAGTYNRGIRESFVYTPCLIGDY